MAGNSKSSGKTISWTAYFIAASTLKSQEEEAGKAVLPQGLASSLEKLIKQLETSFLVPRFVDRLIWYLVPTVPLHVALRKRFMFEEVEDGIMKKEAKQVIVFGGGLDCLSWILSQKYPDILFVEIDHPITQQAKLKALKSLDENRTKPSNLNFLAVDFRTENIEEKIRKCLSSWDSHAVSIGVSEGVFMYLSEEDILDCLRSFRKLTAPSSKLLFQYQLDSLIKHKWLTPLRSLIFKVAKEPLEWLPSSLQDVDALVKSAGFDIDRSVGRTDLHQRFLVPLKPEIQVDPSYDLAQFRNYVAIATNQADTQMSASSS